MCSLNQIVLYQGRIGEEVLTRSQVNFDEKTGPKFPSTWTQRYWSRSRDAVRVGIVVNNACSDTLCSDLAEGKFQTPFVVASATEADSLILNYLGPEAPKNSIKGPNEFHESNLNIADFPFPI